MAPGSTLPTSAGVCAGGDDREASNFFIPSGWYLRYFLRENLHGPDAHAVCIRTEDQRPRGEGVKESFHVVHADVDHLADHLFRGDPHPQHLTVDHQLKRPGRPERCRQGSAVAGVSGQRLEVRGHKGHQMGS